jgi:hypothetical protein
MDPNAILDITLDWSDYLADIGSPAIAKADFTVAGAQNVGAVGRGNLTSLFVSAVSGATTASIACRITTATTPQVIDDRTLYLKFEDK